MRLIHWSGRGHCSEVLQYEYEEELYSRIDRGARLRDGLTGSDGGSSERVLTTAMYFTDFGLR